MGKMSMPEMPQPSGLPNATASARQHDMMISVLREKTGSDAVEPLRLYHISGARSTRILWLYHELQECNSGSLPPLQVTVFDESFRTHKPAWYLALNPNGKVPTLVHGDRVIWDSVAICVYLLGRFDRVGRLAQLEDASFAAQFWQLAFYCSNTVDNLTATSSPLQMVLSDPKPGDHHEAIKLNHVAWVHQCGPVLVQALGESSYMAGPRFTALDVIVGMCMHWIHEKRGWRDFPVLEGFGRLISSG